MLREELQLLQEQGSYVGEVVKPMDKKKVLVKVCLTYDTALKQLGGSNDRFLYVNRWNALNISSQLAIIEGYFSVFTHIFRDVLQERLLYFWLRNFMLMMFINFYKIHM